MSSKSSCVTPVMQSDVKFSRYFLTKKTFATEVATTPLYLTLVFFPTFAKFYLVSKGN